MKRLKNGGMNKAYLLATSLSNFARAHTHTHTHCLTVLCPGLPGWASTRKVKPIWILLKQETMRAVVSAGPYASQHLAPDR